MNVRCPNCSTVYRVDPAKVPEQGVRARCAVCSAVFPVARERVAGAAPVSTPPPPVAEAPVVEPPRVPVVAAPTPASSEPPRMTPRPAAPAVGPSQRLQRRLRLRSHSRLRRPSPRWPRRPPHRRQAW